MEAIPGYRHIELVQDFAESTIYRALNKKNEKAVIIKVYKDNQSKSYYDKAKYQIDRIRKIESSLIAKPLRIFTTQGQLAISWEDKGAMFLSVILEHYKPEIEAFFEIASRITLSLGELHSSQLLQLDLRPHNILLNQRTGEVFFTGFNISPQRTANRKKLPPETLGEDLFIYTAPELTGRISWEVDQKSDLYSLGVLFYVLLTGNPPFIDLPPSKRIQRHLVTEPKSIQEILPSCPVIVDQIVQKLLSKGPEDRYQSAYGLHKDLDNCRTQYKSGQGIESFELGQKDNIERLSIPSKLYGSQENYLTLIESLNRVFTGSVEMVLVEGNAGMGKTTLISELLDLASQKGAYVGRGKCDKEYRDTPYYSVINACKMLIRNIINEGESRVADWREKFSKSLGKNGQLVIDFIPELEMIIGEQSPVPKLDADESQNRLNHTFRRFLQTFTEEGEPLVIFLDGFQWVDLASMQLIQAALSDLGSRYILLIVAFQQQLISRSHMFSVALEEIKQSGISINRIKVTALGLMDVCQMIEDALSFKQDFKWLAKHILEFTGGNPYFVKQYLLTIYEKRLILFDPKEARWVWDIDAITEAKIPNHVVALMADKVNSLKSETVELLKLAACIGNQFDLDSLKLLAKKDKRSILQLLEEAIEKGLIRLVEQETKKASSLLSFQNQMPSRKDSVIFQFSHSRVHHATYSLLKAKERKSIHLSLGRLLIKEYAKEGIDHHAYQIVNQMNQGLQLIKKPDERYELAKLNLKAGKLSQATAAFETAWKYFSIGSELLSSASWDDDYELTKELYLKRSECEYFIGNTEAAEPIFNLLLSNVRTKREKVDVIDLKLKLYIKNNRLEDAIEIGLLALSSIFKEDIPPNNAEITIVSQLKMQEIQAELDHRKIETLLYQPEMVDSDKKAILDLIRNIIPAAYIARRNLWIFLTLRMVDLSLKYGNCESSAYGYMNYAVILCSGLQDYASGYAMGQLALDLNNRMEGVSLVSQLNFLFGSYIGHWMRKASENFKYLKRSYRSGIDFGDYISASMSVDFLLKTQIIVGTPLEEIQKEVKKHQDFVEQYNNPDLASILKISEMMMILKDPPDDEKEFDLEIINSTDLFNAVENSKNLPLKQWYYLVRAQINFLLYNHKEALTLMRKSDSLMASYSQLAVAEHFFYYSLVILENYNGFSDEEKKRSWDILKNNHLRLSTMAKGCSINFKDKEVLLSALMAGVSGNYIKAGDLFDSAIQLAIDNGFLQNEAIANEQAAKYYLSKGKTTIATAYLRKACLAYVKWGAMGKLKHLESSYPQILKQRQRYNDLSELENEETEKSSIFSDLGELIKISKEISSEPELNSLVIKLLKAIVENSNSEKGFFLIESKNHLKIIAHAEKAESVSVKGLSVLLEDFEDIAHSVVFYVIRTRRQIILDDASKDSTFAYNNYIQENQPKSILCIPIIMHDKLRGVLYLENGELIRAFPPKFVDMLNLLLTQITASIENSILYDQIEMLKERLESSERRFEKRIQLLELELQSRIS